jgi:uroporphyrinogen-III synthase
MPGPPKASNLPLSGQRILIGRARHQAGTLAAALRERGAEVVEIPFIEIRPPRSYFPLDRSLKKLAEYDWLILTSVNGVDALQARLSKLRISHRQLRHLKIAAIGPATKKAIERLGLSVDVVPQEYVAESVVKSLRNRVRGARVLLARARVARDVIPRKLQQLGADIDVVEAYETVLPESSRKSLRTVLSSPAKRPTVITFTSSSTVRNFMALFDPRTPDGRGDRPHKNFLDGIRLASIGPVTSATMKQLGLAVHIQASQYTIPGLVQAIVAACRV